MKKLKKIHGIGINDADYVISKYKTVGYSNGRQTQTLMWRCPFYIVWSSMLKRCYSLKFHQSYPTYKGCMVCEEWKLFSNFKSWMEKQDWEGNQLDKDLLVKGNKLYSPDTCVFVSTTVNNFILDAAAIRGEYLIGVHWHKRDKKFIAQGRNPFLNKKVDIGRFDTEQEAHKAWLDFKVEIAHKLASIQTNPLVASALTKLFPRRG